MASPGVEGPPTGPVRVRTTTTMGLTTTTIMTTEVAVGEWA